MQARFLITTADENTWRNDTPVLFLGEWCKLFNRRHVWESMDSKIVFYHWNDRKKFSEDYEYLQQLYEKILRNLANKLNELNGVDRSLRYWRILVGPWLGYFIQIVFDRWSMVDKAVSQHEISGVRVYKKPKIKIVANDMQEFVHLMTQDKWNEAIYSELLRNFTDLNIEEIPPKETCEDISEIASPLSTQIPLRSRCRRIAINSVQRVTNALVRDTDAFIVASYMPFKQELELYSKLKQIPMIWGSVGCPKIGFDSTKRMWVLSSIDEGFASIVCSMIPKHIPSLYLEGYIALQKQLNKLPWPKYPKFIFSSNKFLSDDIFKAWSGVKAEMNIPLIVVQHGGGYGISKKFSNEEHEISIADKYLTWGWDNSKFSHIFPACCLKSKNSRYQNMSSKSMALMVTTSYPRYSYKLTSEPLSSQWLTYFEEQCHFVASLSNVMRQKLLIRLSPYDYGWCQEQRWVEKFSEIRLDRGLVPISTLLDQCKVYISTYNATTYLESLSQNIPTLMFWNPRLWELREDAMQYFDQLKQVGIFHETPISAAIKLGEIWDDVAEWWNQSSIQEIRIDFCHRFARQMDNPVKTLMRILG